MKLCPDYSTTFVRDRALWLYMALTSLSLFGGIFGLTKVEGIVEVRRAADRASRNSAEVQLETFVDMKEYQLQRLNEAKAAGSDTSEIEDLIREFEDIEAILQSRAKRRTPEAEYERTRLILYMVFSTWTAFFVLWLWLLTRRGKFAWWWCFIWQVLSMLGYFGAFLMFWYIFYMMGPMLAAGPALSVRIAGFLSMESYFNFLAGVITFLTLANVLFTLWWWRRRWMHGIRLGARL